MTRLLSAILLLCTLPLHAQQWNWAVDAGGTGNTDFCWGIATDSQGNAYWVGSVSGTADFGCGTITAGSTIAGAIAKYSPTGICQWVRGITVGFNDAWAYGIAIDAQNRIYVTGSYDGNATFSNGVTLSSLGSDDIFLARYDVDGNCVWARRAGSSGSSDEARGVAVSNDGGVFITGFSGGNTITFDAITIPNAGNFRQVVIARYDSTGTVQWARASTGTGGKSARAIALAGGRLFITGQMNFNTVSFGGIPITTDATSGKIYVLSTDLQGNALWARSYGTGDNEGFGIAADTLGNLFVSGRLWGSLVLPDATLASVSSNDDILLLGFDQLGNYRWGKSTGSTQRDLAWDVTADNQGNAYVAAQFLSTIDFFGTSLTALGGEDIAIAKIETDGDVVWAARAGGGQRDVPLCIHRQTAAPHKLYFGGYYWGPVTYGSTTIDDVANGDAMMVSAVDTTFDVSLVTTPTCPGSCDGTITAFVNGTGPFDLLWSNGGTTNTLVDLCAQFYAVEVFDGTGQVIGDVITVDAHPDPGYTIQTLNDSLWIVGGTSWEWFFNGSTAIGGDSASLVADMTGNYHAVVTDANGCTWNSNTVLVVLNTGLGSVGYSPVRIMPNPAVDVVRVLSDRRVVSVVARDVSGRLSSIPMIGPGAFSVAELSSGIWLLELRMDDGRTTMSRLVKQ